MPIGQVRHILFSCRLAQGFWKIFCCLSVFSDIFSFLQVSLAQVRFGVNNKKICQFDSYLFFFSGKACEHHRQCRCCRSNKMNDGKSIKNLPPSLNGRKREKYKASAKYCSLAYSFVSINVVKSIASQCICQLNLYSATCYLCLALYNLPF